MSRVAIVTGGAGGIGLELVRVLAQKFTVVSFDIAANSADAANATSDVHPSVKVDVTDSAKVVQAVNDVVQQHGRLDVLINNAAILECYAVHDTPEAVWDRVMDVNLKGAFLMSRAAIPHLRRVEGGSIVNISSVHAFASLPRTAAYAASKGALVSLSRQMAIDYADDGIRVNCVVVGGVDTAMSAAHGEAIVRDRVRISPPEGQLGRTTDPAEVAQAISFLVSDSASAVNASAFIVDAGLLARLM